MACQYIIIHIKCFIHQWANKREQNIHFDKLYFLLPFCSHNAIFQSHNAILKTHNTSVWRSAKEMSLSELQAWHVKTGFKDKNQLSTFTFICDCILSMIILYSERSLTLFLSAQMQEESRFIVHNKKQLQPSLHLTQPTHNTYTQYVCYSYNDTDSSIDNDWTLCNDTDVKKEIIQEVLVLIKISSQNVMNSLITFMFTWVCCYWLKFKLQNL